MYIYIYMTGAGNAAALQSDLHKHLMHDFSFNTHNTLTHSRTHVHIYTYIHIYDRCGQCSGCTSCAKCFCGLRASLKQAINSSRDPHMNASHT